jgi:hypothetical protein
MGWRDGAIWLSLRPTYFDHFQGANGRSAAEPSRFKVIFLPRLTMRKRGFGAEATATPSQAIDPTDVPTTHLRFSFSGRANAWAYRLFSYVIY